MDHRGQQELQELQEHQVLKARLALQDQLVLLDKLD